MKSNMKKVGGTSNIKTIFLKMTFFNLQTINLTKNKNQGRLIPAINQHHINHNKINHIFTYQIILKSLMSKRNITHKKDIKS